MLDTALGTEDTEGNSTGKKPQNSPERAYIIVRDADSDNVPESKQWGGENNIVGKEARKYV